MEIPRMIQGLAPLLKNAECVEANGTLSNKQLRAFTFQHVSTLGTADVTLVLRMAHHISKIRNSCSAINHHKPPVNHRLSTIQTS